MPRVVDFKRFTYFAFKQITQFAKTRAKTKSRFGNWGQLVTPPCQGGSVKRANLLGAAFYTVFSHCQKRQNRHNKNNGLQVGFGLAFAFRFRNILIKKESGMIKELFVGSGFDSLLLRVRSKSELIKHAMSRSLDVGTVMNDQLSTYLMVRLCDKEKTFIDIGAHIGSVISEVKRHSSPVKIIAFEAMPDKAKALTKKFPSTDVHCYALSDTAGEAKFYVNDKLSGYSSLNKTQNTREISVAMNTLDNLVDRNDVDVIKIDIEGAELGALRGGVKLIEKCKPVIMFESGPGNVLGYTKEQMWEFFNSLDYRIIIPNRLPHSQQGLSLEAFIDSHQYPRRTTNYFAVHESRSKEVMDKAGALF